MSKELDAFTEGIRIGGLRNRGDIKIMVCYALKSIGCAASKTSVNELLQADRMANYYEVNNALSELTAAGHVILTHEEDDDYYTISDSGKMIADTLYTELPFSLRQTAVQLALKTAAKEKKKKCIKTEIRKHENANGKDVVMRLLNEDDEIFNLTFYCADDLQATAICERFENAPEQVYLTIIDALTKDIDSSDV